MAYATAVQYRACNMPCMEGMLKHTRGGWEGLLRKEGHPKNQILLLHTYIVEQMFEMLALYSQTRLVPCTDEHTLLDSGSVRV